MLNEEELDTKETSVENNNSETKKKDLGEKQWYVVSTYTGREKQVAESLERRSVNLNLKDYIFRIVVAQYEEDGKDKNGKPNGKKVIKNFYPGYIFIEMIMDDKAWYMVRNTPDVTGFVGSSGGGAKPFPVPREEIEPVLKRMKITDDDMFTGYKVGDTVKILTGSFEGSEGTIESINKDTNEVTITTVFFGRPTQIEVKITEIDKIN